MPAFSPFCLAVCGDEPPEKGQSCFRARNEAEVCTSHSSTRPARGKFGQNLGVGFSGETEREFKGAVVVCWGRVSASGRCESCCSLRICPLWMESNWKAWPRGGVVHEVCTQPSQSEENRTKPLKSPTRKPHPLGSGASLPE